MIFFRLGYYLSASPYLCFKLIKYLDITAYNLYCRTLASIHKNAKLVPGIRIYNTRNSPQSIKVNAHTIIAGELMTFGHGGTIEIGEWCYLGENSRIWSAAKVIIGNHVLISHNVNIHDTNAHPINAEKRQTHFYQISSSGHPKSDIDIKSHPIIIKDHVWIGFNSIILKGVTIGEGAIVGAGSIVTKDVPAWTIVAGNPAKVIREIPENER